MAISADEVRAMARLARLHIEDADIPGYAAQLSDVLELVARLNSVATEGVEPLAHPLDITARLRADEVSESDRRADFQRIAPAVEGGLYLVPRVIE